jgi:uncharacterized protein (TIGR00295 family)
MLSRNESLELLVEYGQGSTWVNHCLAVADSASRLGRALEGPYAIDRDYLWSSALLHDIGRYVTHDPIRHGVEGYKLLSRLGHEKEAFVCVSHVLFGLKASEAVQFGLPDHDFIPHTIEQRLVPLVDLMTEGVHATTLERRFSSLRKRYVENSYLMNRLDRAQQIARSFLIEISEALGESAEKIIGVKMTPEGNRKELED